MMNRRVGDDEEKCERERERDRQGAMKKRLLTMRRAKGDKNEALDDKESQG
ncbi:hypothetical protein DY000_02014698 [Brassica cretica]|uniref:IBB domain-containing protein n=1 Tax=Brassica cretica TaxID=69181 RepID=A0ABQ7D4K7_BRACR|nr:hypothetical protein DY000_02014698 [Brassica cretica]